MIILFINTNMGNYCVKHTKIENNNNKENERKEEYDNIFDMNNGETIQGHKLNRSTHYIVNYPDHVKRKDSAIYKRSHHELCHIRDTPCFICGKTQKKYNISLETHHFYCEKSAENAIDWQEFSKFATNCYNIQTGINIGNTFNWKEVELNPDIFIDSIHNMIVLCKEHHISGGKGIHHIPFPDWIIQKYPKNGFEFLLLDINIKT